MKAISVELVVIAISASVGVSLCAISWGDPAGFHGTGWPFPVSCWDNGIDYVSPFGFLLNPTIATLPALLLIVTHRIWKWVLTCYKKNI